MNANEIKTQVIKEWNQAKNKPYIITRVLYITIFIFGWMEYVFRPLSSTIDSYVLVEDKDPVIAISLAGFLLLSLWFTVSVVEPFSTFVTLKLYNKVRKMIPQKNGFEN